MDKQPQFSDTKGTDLSFPIILSSLKEREGQSQKTLFKNDSLSSNQGEEISQIPKKISIPANLPELGQIKKFLQRADQINNDTLRKLKQDRQIELLTKHDRSSASLYKTSRKLDFGSENSKEKQIKRIYLSQKKTKSRPLFVFPIYRGRRTSIQVQTDAVQPELMIGSRKNLTIQPISFPQGQKYPSFQHHLSYNTIEAIEEEFKNKRLKKQEMYDQIQQDLQADKLLPNRQRKNVSAKAKALSSKPSIDGYVKAIGKTSFDFVTGVNKLNNRYKQYKQQETIFSKTIDTKPLLPIKETINIFPETNLNANLQIEKNPKAILNEFKLKDQEQSQFIETKQLSKMQDSTIRKIEKVESRIEEMEKKIESFKESIISQPLVPLVPSTFDKSERQFQHKSSMIPQQSENLSPELSSRSRQMPSRGPQNLLNLIPASPLQKKRPKPSRQKKQKPSILVQVPSAYQLKIGNTDGTSSQVLHPIRQGFSKGQMNWLQSQYSPRHEILKGANHMNFHIKKYKNGVYFGQLDQQGRKHGKGSIFYYTGKIYQGEIVNDLKQGKGLEIYPDGSRFKGQFLAGKKQGRGVFEWNNGELYDGQWVNGRKNGSGMWKGNDGESYIGQWKNDKVEGFGVYVMKNGSRYEGEFKNSLKHGMGTQRFFNGQTYVGNYDKNRPNGEGQYYWSNGDYYKGQFSNGLRHGQGYFKEGKTGIQYRGQYKNDKKCGYGQINYENNISYIGNFENNYRHGFGQLSQNGHLKYRGYWINDQQVDEINFELEKKALSNKKKESKAITIPIHTIKQDELERQQSLPKPIVITNHNKTHRTHTHDHSPEGAQGYKRPCGCNKKH